MDGEWRSATMKLIQGISTVRCANVTGLAHYTLLSLGLVGRNRARKIEPSRMIRL
jgi:hypothetical protein